MLVFKHCLHFLKHAVPLFSILSRHQVIIFNVRFAFCVNISILNWTCSCQHHSNPIVSKNSSVQENDQPLVLMTDTKRLLNDQPQREQLKSLSKGENGLRPNPL